MKSLGNEAFDTVGRKSRIRPRASASRLDLEVAVGELHLGEPLGHDHAVTQGVELRAGVVAAVANVLQCDRIGFPVEDAVEVDPDVFRANNDAHMVPFAVLKPLKKPTEPEPTAHQYNVARLHFGCDLLVRGRLRAHGAPRAVDRRRIDRYRTTQAVSTPGVGMSATQKTRKRSETGQRFGPDELQQVIDGAAFLGSGGGGSIAVAKELRRVILELTDKRGVMVTPVDAVGAKETAAVAADVGASNTYVPKQEIATINAFNKLADLHFGITGDFDYVLPGEVGAENSLAPIAVAAKLGIPVIDADGSQRAIPTLGLSLYASPASRPARR